MKKKNTYNPEFKSKVVLELLSGQHTLNELAEKYQISPATLSSWHKQFQEHASEVFSRGATVSVRGLEGTKSLNDSLAFYGLKDVDPGKRLRPTC